MSGAFLTNPEGLLEVANKAFTSMVANKGNSISFINLDEFSAQKYQEVLSNEGGYLYVELQGPSVDCSVLKDREAYSVIVRRRAA